jgi:eukaryotic-like serine/threonine-protein kinase
MSRKNRLGAALRYPNLLLAKRHKARCARLLPIPRRVGGPDRRVELGPYESRPFVQIGTRLGRYEIVGPLGKGGMGEVYLARDTSVGRDVAIKLLPDELLADGSRLRRLRREARVLASLNHPNIAGLYALEEEHSVPFLVLELVAGETLASRLSRGPMPLREALQVAVEIADALATVHGCGIVHRDLKPSNVMLTTKGRAKLLDFGIARRDSIDTDASTGSRDAETTSGHFVGTPAYMSPEQITGSPAGEQSDIWAFGCVLYESVTGSHPFRAPTRSDQLAAILEREPDWQALDECPVKVRDLIRRCLRKDPAQRLHDIADARIEIQEILEYPVSEGEPPPMPVWKAWKVLALAALGLALYGLGLLVRQRPEPTIPFVMGRFAIDLGGKLAFGIDYPASVAISRQGDLVAYVAEADGVPRIHVRAMDAIQPRPLDGTTGAQQPFFSPDGRWLGFFADGKLKKVSVRGGAPITLCAASDGAGGAWSAEGWIVFAPSDSGLRRVSEQGGESEVFSQVRLDAGEQAHLSPILLADQRTVLFTVDTGGRNTVSRIALQTLGQKDHRVVVEGGSHARLVPPRWLVYGRGAELLAVEFDSARGVVTGIPFRVLEGVQDTPSLGAPVFAVSDEGTLVYAPAVTAGYDGRMSWLDRSGKAVDEVEAGHAYCRPRLSPDGTRVVFHLADPDFNVWVKDLTRGTRTKITTEPGFDGFGVWSPDGRQIVFSSARAGPRTLFAQAADGSGGAERLLPVGNPRFPTSWSPNGEWLAFHEENPGTGLDVSLLNMRDKTVRPFLHTVAGEAGARFSPDGAWLAYSSDESGAEEVYVCSVGDPSQRLQVSAGGGTGAIWSPAGDEVFYSHGSQFMSVPIRLGKSPKAERPRVLFSTDKLVNDVGARGDRFLAVDAPTSVSITRLEVVLGWPRALARLSEAR